MAENTNYVVEREFEETVVSINRVSKKTKGGNTMAFTALVVIGDKKGKVGSGLAKARDVRGAIQKAVAKAKVDMIEAPVRGSSIPFDVKMKYNAARVLLKPAPKGSGVIAGGPVRVVLEAAGIRDVVGKILGSNSKISNVRATIAALESLGEMEKRGKQLALKKKNISNRKRNE